MQLNNTASKYGREKLIELQGEVDKLTIILQHLSFSKNIADLNSTLNQTDLIDIYRWVCPETTEYMFSQAHKEHLPGQTTSWAINLTLTNLIEIMQIIFSDNNRIKLEIDNRMILGKVPNIWKLKTHY